MSGLKELEDETGDRIVMCVTGDHSTPVDYGDHSAEPGKKKNNNFKKK